MMAHMEQLKYTNNEAYSNDNEDQKYQTHNELQQPIQHHHHHNGVCPHCNHESLLLDIITPGNRHSHLTELRDKLSALETLASILKQQILQVQSYVCIIKFNPCSCQYMHDSSLF